MAVKAARRALENAGICSTELDLILVGTSSSESIFPNTACLVQDEIGASCALSISDIPFEGPIAGVRVGRVDGKFIINRPLSRLRSAK